MQPYFQTLIESEASYHRQKVAEDFRRSGGRSHRIHHVAPQRRWYAWRRDGS
jgi:hypothetical protein